MVNGSSRTIFIKKTNFPEFIYVRQTRANKGIADCNVGRVRVVERTCVHEPADADRIALYLFIHAWRDGGACVSPPLPVR